MNVQKEDDQLSQKTTTNATAHDLADPVVSQPATLVAPVIVQSPDIITSGDEPVKPSWETIQNSHPPQDGHEDVDNEQPYGWVVVGAAFFVQAIVIGTVNGYGIYQDRYTTHEYRTSSTFELAWVGTLNVVGMDLSGPLTGQFADHYGYRLSAFAGALIMGASLIATSFSTQVWQLYIFQGILYGLGASLAFFPSLSLPSQWFKRRRGFATGIAVAGGGFGGLVMSPATTALFDKIGYRWTVRVIALLHLAILIPAAALFKGRVESGRAKAKRLRREQLDRESSMTEQEKQNTATALTVDAQMNSSQITLTPKKKLVDFSVLKEKRFLLLVILSFFVANGYFNPYYFFPTYAQTHGASVSTASLLVGILNGSSAIGRVTMGLASDFIGDINTLLISCISRLASVTGIVYGGIAVGTLIGSPVGGALLDMTLGENYRPLQLWAGLVMAVGVALTVILKFSMNPKLLGRV
ncbi:hypothetical protein BG011_005010 [Mortierella polycephala]|uniref:Major facilitator superfamily (MFS) profile domain-containing protein n=1 Tax=Mortierella polycephala TaxID=41804 RepID=A0A9P6QCG6_9FUNG|nr:hypothetical protein BG011_005010 [Mortierella polycephala]